MKATYVIFRATLLLLCITLPVGCGDGFHAVQPSGSNDDLVYRINDSTVAQVDGVGVVSTEMPLLDKPPSTSGQKAMIQGEPRRVVEAPPEQGAQVIVDGTVELADLSAFPYNKVGRLLSKYAGQNLSSACTAQLIGKNGVILTAAHCLYDRNGKGWAESTKFHLGYKDGISIASYDWECMAIVSGWPNHHSTDDTNYLYDYAFVKLRGTPPTGLGMTINVAEAKVDAVGYPDKYYNGQQLVHVTGAKDGFNPSRMQNSMGKGSSGGAWVQQLQTGPGDVISVNSFGLISDPSVAYGPILSPNTMKIYEFVSRSCQDRVAPQGDPPEELLTSLDEGYSTVLQRAQVDISAGSFIQIDSSDDCGCGGTAYYANNSTDGVRLIGTREVLTNGASPQASTLNKYLELAAHDRKFLGCVRESKTERKLCEVDRQVRITSDRGKTIDRPPATPPGITMAQALAAGDINRCVSFCKINDNRVCLDLGQGAIPALAPLAKLSGEVDSASSGNGTVIRKDTVIAEYSGDPATKPDVCERSDVVRKGPNVVNDGWGCNVATKRIAGSLTTRLNMPASIRGTPSAWSPPLASMSSTPVTYFTDRLLAPSIDFVGNPAFNKRYMGDIYASTKVSEKQLVVATSNGCLIGNFK